MFYCYIHYKPDGDPFYVGKGTGNRAYDFTSRSKWHKSIVAKYGKENIQVEIIYCTSEHEAFEEEIFWIWRLREEGYPLVNLCDGGDGGTSGCKKSEATKEKIRKSNLGKTVSNETKEKLRNHNLGKRWDCERRYLLILEYEYGLRTSAMLGAKHTEDAKKKNRAAHLGKQAWNKGKPWSAAVKNNIRLGKAKRKLHNLEPPRYG